MALNESEAKALLTLGRFAADGAFAVYNHLDSLEDMTVEVMDKLLNDRGSLSGHLETAASNKRLPDEVKVVADGAGYMWHYHISQSVVEAANNAISEKRASVLSMHSYVCHEVEAAREVFFEFFRRTMIEDDNAQKLHDRWKNPRIMKPNYSSSEHFTPSNITHETQIGIANNLYRNLLDVWQKCMLLIDPFEEFLETQQGKAPLSGVKTITLQSDKRH